MYVLQTHKLPANPHVLVQSVNGYRKYEYRGMIQYKATSQYNGVPVASKHKIDPLGPPQTRVKKQETKRFSTFVVSRLRHSETKKNIA